jgi:hypothetical protein
MKARRIAANIAKLPNDVCAEVRAWQVGDKTEPRCEYREPDLSSNDLNP